MNEPQESPQSIASSPTPEQLKRVGELNQKGLCLQAWKVVASCKDYRHWPAGEARRWAAVLSAHLGSPRWSDVLDWKNWRSEPSNERYFYRAQLVRIAEGR